MSSEKFVEKLLSWFERNKRDYLPWRSTKDPFKILVAEMMLQKTTSKQVAKLYDRFVEKYPSPASLADAPTTEIEDEIASLGMEHKKAQRFKKLARILVEKYAGEVPNNKDALVLLPGIGNYIANAVLCLAYGKEVSLLDTNIARVLNRVFGIKSSKARARTDKELWDKVERMIPRGKAREFNLGLVDFGGLVCEAKNPKCETCPMVDFCLYFKEVVRNE